VAFIALGDRIELIDAQGVLMEIPPAVQSDYSFPVILGMTESEPLSTRAPRMKTFMRLMRELDGGDAGTRQAAPQSAPRQKRNTRAIWTRWTSPTEDVKVTAKGALDRLCCTWAMKISAALHGVSLQCAKVGAGAR